MKVSVIIPIFNSERHLIQCLQSVIDQTYNNLEILLIDDGSKDNSLKICEFYRSKDKRIKVFSNLNHGVSYSRNFGINKSTGDFLVFIDSDDYIEKNMIRNLVQTQLLTRAELIVCNYTTISPFKKRKVNFGLSSLKISDIEGTFSDLLKKSFFSSIWNKLFLKIRITILFNEEANINEDLMFILNYLNNITKIEFISESLYNYRTFNLNSLTKVINQNELISIVHSSRLLSEFCNYFHFNNNYREIIYFRTINNFLGYFVKLPFLNVLNYYYYLNVLKQIQNMYDVTQNLNHYNLKNTHPISLFRSNNSFLLWIYLLLNNFKFRLRIFSYRIFLLFIFNT